MASLGAIGSTAVNTLQGYDSLDGATGTDTLRAVLVNDATPDVLDNIEIVSATAAAAATLGLDNAGELELVSNNASTAALTVSGIVAGADLEVRNTTRTTTFTYADTTGLANEANLDVLNVTGAATINVAGVETINLTSLGSTANAVFLNNQADLNTVVIDGDNDLTLTGINAATEVDATLLTGNLTIALGGAAQIETLTGGQGNDQLTVATAAVSISGKAGDDILVAFSGENTIDGGAGDDIIYTGSGDDAVDAGTEDDLVIFAEGAFDNSDTVDGGEGYNELWSFAADAETYVDVAGDRVTNIDALVLEDEGNAGATLNVANISSGIDFVDLADGAAVGAGNYTVTFNSGASTLDVGAAAANAGTLTLTQATAAQAGDSLTILNTATTGDIFNNITATGIETLVIDSGEYATAVEQQIATLAVNPSTASMAVNVSIQGSNAVDIATALTSTTTGLLTVDASALDAQAAGTTTLDIASVTLGAAGTLSVIGSAGDDLIAGATNRSSTLKGGLGDDELTGSTLADSLHGGSGDDVLTGNGGSDIFVGDAGNDTINANVVTLVTDSVSVYGGAGDDVINIGNTLTSGDVIDGGDDFDTLRQSTPLIADYANVTNIEALQLDAAMTQNLARFTGATLEQININNAGVNTLTNASVALDTLALANAASTTTLTRAAGVTTGALTIEALAAGNTTVTAVTASQDATVMIGSGASEAGDVLTIGTLTAAGADAVSIGGIQDTTITTLNTGAESVSINSAGNVAITTLTDATLNTLSVAGDGNVTIGTLTAAAIESIVIAGDGNVNIAGGTLTALSTIDASLSTGDVTVNATSATDDITFTAGAGNASIVAGSGDDTLTGGAAASTLIGGAGADSITSADAIDQITGGTGADLINLTSVFTGDTIWQTASSSVAATATDYAGATIEADDTITFANEVDLVQSFAAGEGGDVLAIGTATADDLVGTSTSGTTIGYVSGYYNALTGIFTVAADNEGTDTLVTIAGDVATSTSRAIILQGVNAGDLVDGNFTWNFTDLVGTLTGTSWAFTGHEIQAVTMDLTQALSTNVFSNGGADASYTFDGVWNRATLTVIDLSDVTGGGANVNVSNAVNAALTSLVGTAGNDTFTVATNVGLATGGLMTVDGTSGTDTIVVTRVVDTGASNILATNLANIDNLYLANGTVDASAVTQTLTIGAEAGLTIENRSATAASTVVLGAAATQVYNSTIAGSTAVDTVTLGAAGQSVNTAGGNDTVNTNVANSASSTIAMGGGTSDTIAVSNAGTVTLRTARVLATDTLISGVEAVSLTGISTLNLTQDVATAVTAGSGATIVNANGTGTVTVSSPGAGNLLTLGGTSNFVANAVNTGGVTSTMTGTLTVVSANAAQTITSAGVTSIDATLIADGTLLTTAGAGAFNVTGLQGNITSTVTGSVAATLVDVATVTATNTSGGTMTINAAAMTDGDVLTLGAGAGAYVVTSVSDSDVGTTLSASTGGATITGTAGAVTQNIWGTAAVDSVTIVATAATAVNATTGDGADTINLTGTATDFSATGGTGADTITFGTGTATAVLDTGDTGAQNTIGTFVATINYDHYYGIASGDLLDLSAVTGGSAFTDMNAVSNAVTGQAGDITFVRGNEVGGIFTADAVGEDTLVVYDTGAATYEAVVIVGSVVTGDTDTSGVILLA